nr:sugar phosphate isomerase/epimerase [Anaerolineae bacterium]
AATLQELPLQQALDVIRDLGADVVDLATGGYGTKVHCDPAALLARSDGPAVLRRAVEERGLAIGALCCYGNPLHPNRDVALAHRRDLRDTIVLAGRLGLHKVVTFSGCPGDSGQAAIPNWVTYPWPPEQVKLRQWQWEHALLPFWASQAQFALEHGVTQLCLEMHAVNAVYNPETLLELRRLVGDVIVACFNPGHLFWQGVDPVHAIRALGAAVGHVHITDTHADPLNAPAHGLLDAKPFYYEHERCWSWRTVGYGHGEETWREMVVALRLAGYDDAIVVQHEDTMLMPAAGLRRSLEMLGRAVVRAPLAVPEPPPVQAS